MSDNKCPGRPIARVTGYPTPGGSGARVYHGDFHVVLDEEHGVDAVITDAPYSATTHKGHDALSSADGADRRVIAYEPWSELQVRGCVEFWTRRCRGWMVSVTDDVLAPIWRRAFQDNGLYAFAPLPAVIRGSRVRLAGDGPSSWTYWVVVARPRTKEFARWGTLPGAYCVTPERGMPLVGAKPLELMRALVRDYSRPGDLICDPCAGSGTTLRAAQLEGRRAIGAELDARAYEIAVNRITEPFSQSFDFSTPVSTKVKR